MNYKLQESDQDQDLCVEEETDELIYPFDTSSIEIQTGSISIFNLVGKMTSGEIDFAPDFQRHPDLWKPTQQSRLIESLMLGIPLPAFYFDAEYIDVADAALGRVRRQVWHVVDGLQRLSAIRNFLIGKPNEKGQVRKTKLIGLEYLRKLNGMTFDQLSSALQRSIHESTLLYYLIRPSTPEDIKFNIFKRVNTGGLPLKPQEIRHAILHGPGTAFLSQLAGMESFVTATGGKISSRRMLDRELANRFVAFYLLDPEESYRTMDVFLNDAIRVLNKMDTEALRRCQVAFDEALRFIHETLGEFAFKRYLSTAATWHDQVNKSVFEALVVGVARLDARQRERVRGHADLQLRYRDLFSDQGAGSFADCVGTSTGNRQKVLGRHQLMKAFLNELAEDPA